MQGEIAKIVKSSKNRKPKIMKKICSLTGLLFFMITTFSQNKNGVEQIFEKVNFGLGAGYGVIYPKDLNNFLEDAFDNTYFSDGFPEIILYVNGNINLQYFVNNNLEVCTELTGTWAPKFISGASPDYYYLTAVSPGLIANYHIKSKKKKNNSIFIGAGINYNFLTFKFDELKTTGSTPGFLIQFGMMSTIIGSTPFKNSLSYRYIKTDNIKSNKYYNDLNELSFSGIHYTICYYF